MTTAITGGSGVVGSALVRRLIDSGVRPRVLSRSEQSDRVFADLGATIFRGDLFSGLEPFLDGVDTLFHVAGVNEMCVRDPSVMYHVNVDGAVNVARAARSAGVRRLVLTSSAATIGEEKGTVGREDTIHTGRYLSHYERSKHLGELAVLDAVPDLEVVVVNPSSVQGPGRATGTGKLILDVLNGRLSFLVDTQVSIVDIDDCVNGHLLAARHGVPGQRYILSSFTVEIRDAVSILEEVTGRRIPIRYLPGWVASAAAAVVETGSRTLGLRPPICGEMVRTMLHGHTYDGSRAERDLGLTYAGPRDLMLRLVRWFQQEGLLA